MSDIKIMTEEQIGKMIGSAYWDEGEGADLFDQFIDEYRSFKSTVESQKSQLATCKEAIEAIVDDKRIQKAKTDDWIQKVEAEARGYMKQLSNKSPDISSLITTIESQNSQIESLKAITELAVKGLKEVLYFSKTGTNSFESANSTLSEIERLTNGTT